MSMFAPSTPFNDSQAQTNQAAAGVKPVTAAIQEAAVRTGVDFSYLMAKAAQESGMNPNAKASSSSATGLFQFIDRTWLTEIETHGAQYGLGRYAAQIQTRDGAPYVDDPAARQEILNLRRDPRISALMAAEYAKDNKIQLQETVGGRIGATELYIAHFLGAGGAGKFLTALRQNPAQPADALLPEAAAANDAVFYDKAGNPLSVSQVYDRFARKFGNSDGVEETAAAGTQDPKTLTLDAPGANQSINIFELMVLSQVTTGDQPIDPGLTPTGNGSLTGRREQHAGEPAPAPGLNLTGAMATTAL